MKETIPTHVTSKIPPSWTLLNPFPVGPFRFVALDVETANNDIASICQIGVACVRPDNKVEKWVTFVDPGTNDFKNSWVHGIAARDVVGSPSIMDVLAVIAEPLMGITVYQHSNCDHRAIKAACAAHSIEEPAWTWQDSIKVAKKAWPELKGNGGYGLKNPKSHLRLKFRHHDAGEDAWAAAQVVLSAEAGRE